MNAPDNPYQSPRDEHRALNIKRGLSATAPMRPRGSQLVAIGLMLFVPIPVGMATAFLCQYLDESLGWDERYLSLLLGVPAALVAICLAVFLWRRGFRFVPIGGALLWSGNCVMFVLTTLAFWDG